MSISMEKNPSVMPAPVQTTTVTETFDIVQEKNEIVSKYKGSPEVDRLTTEISVYDNNSIVKFGSGVANELSKASDAVINSMSVQQLNSTGELMKALTKIMEQFDAKEIENDPKGLKKLFGGVQKQFEKLIDKYDNMGKAIEGIYIQLKQWETEIGASTKYLEDMFNANKNLYHTLELYILAGEQGCEEIQSAIDDANARFNSGDTEAQFDVQSLTQAKQLLEQRVQDLRITEQVAMQAIPIINNTAFSNYNLMRKIDSEFIITLPVFKQAIAQAMLLKRQKIQADGVALLDEKANELLRTTAKNSVNQTQQIMQMSTTSSIKMETIEETWNTIMQGIKDTQKIQADASKKRVEDKAKLEQMKIEFKSAYSGRI